VFSVVKFSFFNYPGNPMNIDLQINVTPNALRSKIVGWQGDILKIRLKAVPEKGEANEELIAFLSKFLEMPKSRIALIRGGKSRRKVIRLEDPSDEALKKIEKAPSDCCGDESS
jgi:uncharacterized protein (TIGR00251 family)